MSNEEIKKSGKKHAATKDKKKSNKKKSTYNSTQSKKKNSKSEISNEKKNKNKFSSKHPKIALFLKIIILLIIAIIVIGAGIFAGMLFGSFEEEFGISAEELVISSSNSVVLDSDLNQTAELTGDENRKIIRIEEMPENLINAYVAIEDERFYEHSGVDIKRTAGAIFQYIINKGSSSFGGSTITQQLVKNITNDDDDEGIAGALRKVKEWAKAYQIERMISKEEILELYLNIIFVGGNNYGVELGAEYYFNKSASDLDLAQCAFLAGINNAPNSYNPYDESTDNTEKIKNRTITVLKKMLELGYINQTEYDEAYAEVDAGLVFEKAEAKATVYSYHTDATIAQVIEDIAEAKGISISLATTYVYSSGLTIYSTQNSAIQSQMNDVMVTDSSTYVRTVSGENSQAAMVIIDNETGYVVALSGGLGEKTESRGLNRATQSTRQTGSSIKPLSSLVPGLSEGIITAATIYNDAETTFTVGVDPWKPKNYNTYKGLITIRSAITTSQNIPFAKVVTELGTEKSIEYLEKMGITSIADEDYGSTAAIALGGFTNGISPLEMAGAYATIANDGVYRTPLLYTKVTDSTGATILEPEQAQEEVFTKQVAYVIKDLLKSVVSDGTATYCAISGIDVAAKTGTTNSNKDKWLCGFTNYYTAATWYGFDQNQEVTGSTNVAGKIWAAVMQKVHSGKEASTFEQPEGIETATICKKSGKKATSKCSDTYTEIFVEGTVPEDCDAHSSSTSARVCSETGLLATEYCPNVVTKYYSYTVEKETLGLWDTPSSVSSASPPTSYCKKHTSETANSTSNETSSSTTTTSVPTIKLNGESSMTISVGDSYSEKGATATDEIDGDISSKITTSGTVNTSKAGTYTITYTVTNSSGKSATATRTITVKAKETPQTNTSSSGTTSTNTTNTSGSSNPTETNGTE